MEILYLLVPIGLIVLLIAIRFLFWAINSGQYDDLDTEGQRILFDEDKVEARPGKTLKKEKALSDSQVVEKKGG